MNPERIMGGPRTTGKRLSEFAIGRPGVERSGLAASSGHVLGTVKSRCRTEARSPTPTHPPATRPPSPDRAMPRRPGAAHVSRLAPDGWAESCRPPRRRLRPAAPLPLRREGPADGSGEALKGRPRLQPRFFDEAVLAPVFGLSGSERRRHRAGRVSTCPLDSRHQRLAHVFRRLLPLGEGLHLVDAETPAFSMPEL